VVNRVGVQLKPKRKTKKNLKNLVVFKNKKFKNLKTYQNVKIVYQKSLMVILPHSRITQCKRLVDYVVTR